MIEVKPNTNESQNNKHTRTHTHISNARGNENQWENRAFLIIIIRSSVSRCGGLGAWQINSYTQLDLDGYWYAHTANKMQTDKTKETMVRARQDDKARTLTSTCALLFSLPLGFFPFSLAFYVFIHFAVHPLAALCISLYRQIEEKNAARHCASNK